MTDLSVLKKLFEQIDNERAGREKLLRRFVAISSHSDDLLGLSRMEAELVSCFGALGGTFRKESLGVRRFMGENGEWVEQEQGNLLLFSKHENAPFRVLLGGHYDTVYPASLIFPINEENEGTILRGPGVADMKGGLVVLLSLLHLIESSPFAGKIGWDVFLNPNEEVGSPGLVEFLEPLAKRNHLSLLFEPAFPDGAVVGERRGSMNISVAVRGRSAHAGRDFHLGRNAIVALARFIVKAEALSRADSLVTVNIGKVTGGGAFNIVPDLAICRLNVRASTKEQLSDVRVELEKIVVDVQREDGIRFELYEDSFRPPKIVDAKVDELLRLLKESAHELALPLEVRASGGVCDGNLLAGFGLPTIDTMGVVGGGLHTLDEYLLLSSLGERVKLALLLLCRLAGIVR